MRAVTVLGVLLLIRLAAVAADQPVVVSLNGVRQVEVTIGGDRDAFEVAVRMKPVQCFDKATNERLNAQKARSYGLQGLLKHLSGGKEKVRATVSGVTVANARHDGDFYRLTLRVPRDGIEVVRNSETREPSRKASKPPHTEEVQLASALLTCFGDHAATIGQLVSGFDDELESVRSKPLAGGNEFEVAVAELEEHLTTHFDQLENEVRTDKLLLAAERTKLTGEVVEVRKRSLQGLQSAVEQREQTRTEKNRAAQFRDVEIEPDFEKYLTSNPLLMEVAGAKVVRRKDGSIVVIAVGSTVLNDGSAKERLRAEKVCRVKALTSLVAEKQGVQIAHVEELKDETVVVLENGTEKATSVMVLLKVTKAKVEGITRDMPVIGRWRSAEGDTFYLAIGAVIDRSGKPVAPDEKELLSNVVDEVS